MAVYLSLSPHDREQKTQDDLARALEGIGFTVLKAYAEEGESLREIKFGSEPACRIRMLDDRFEEIEIERNGNCCNAWWCMSWGCGAAAYERQLLHLLDLGERIGWNVCGNSGELVTRENIADEVAHFAGFVPRVMGMLGAPAPYDRFEKMINEWIAKMLEESDDSNSKTDSDTHEN